MAISKRGVILLDVTAVLVLASVAVFGVDYYRGGTRVLADSQSERQSQAASAPQSVFHPGNGLKLSSF